MGLYDKLKDLNPTFQQGAAVTGPGGEQYAYRNPQLDEASARRMAEMMGGTVETIAYNGGPFQTTPQYHIRIPGAADMFDASLIWDQYLRSGNDAAGFDALRQAEIARSRASNDAPGPSPGGPPGAGSGNRGVVIPGAAVPGPTWPAPAVPPPTGVPAVVPGSRGVANPGGFSPGWSFSGSLPPPIELLPPTGLPRAHRRSGGLLTLVPPFAGGLLQP